MFIQNKCSHFLKRNSYSLDGCYHVGESAFHTSIYNEDEALVKMSLF